MKCEELQVANGTHLADNLLHLVCKCTAVLTVSLFATNAATICIRFTDCVYCSFGSLTGQYINMKLLLNVVSECCNFCTQHLQT